MVKDHSYIFRVLCLSPFCNYKIALNDGYSTFCNKQTNQRTRPRTIVVLLFTTKDYRCSNLGKSVQFMFGPQAKVMRNHRKGGKFKHLYKRPSRMGNKHTEQHLRVPLKAASTLHVPSVRGRLLV